MNCLVLIVTITFICGLNVAQDSQSAAASSPDAQSSGVESAGKVPTCGTPESDFAPCIAKERADGLFKQCCQQYAPEGCQSLCQYETDELTARNLNNSKCCSHLNLADAKLGVGDRCLRFCDPAGQGGISSISRADVTCLFNWNVLMYCHHSGIKIE